MTSSEICNFYKDQTILVTGGTGFLGKLIIEKLLRTCWDLRKILVLVRDKNNLTKEERFKQLFQHTCFDAIRKEQQDLSKKLVLVSGDCSKSGLGLSVEDRALLVSEVTCILYGAADVRFNNTLRHSLNTNVRAIKETIILARQIHQLKAFVYVSTAFSHCPRSNIGEEFYHVPISSDSLFKLLEVADDKIINEITPNYSGTSGILKIIIPKYLRLLQKWPNTYCFTKAIAEDVIREEAQDLPIAIVRPAIIFPTYEEPSPGWVDTYFGIIVMTMAGYIGILRSMQGIRRNISYVVPCDHVVNCVLSAAWNTFQTQEEQKITIYNNIGSNNNLVTQGRMYALLEKFFWRMPTNRLVWLPYFVVNENMIWQRMSDFLLKKLPASVLDSFLSLSGKKPFAVKTIERLCRPIDATAYFRNKALTFQQDNVENLWKKMNPTDRKLFRFQAISLDWEEYAKRIVTGIRVHLLNDPLETLPNARRKLYLMAAVHYILLIAFWWLLYQFFKIML